MKNLLKALKSVRKDLSTLLLISIVVYLSIVLYLVHIPGFFPGAYELGQFVSKIAVSYISGFIFYFIVVHLKSVKDKEHVNEYVGHEVFGIITSGHLLIQPLMQKVDKKATFRYLDTKELYELLSQIDPLAKESPLSRNDESATWVEWYAYEIQSTQKHLVNIFQRFQYLDAELVKLLTRIQHSLLITQFDFLVSHAKGNTLAIFQAQIEMYMNLLKELEEYAQKHLKPYEYLTNEFMGWQSPTFTNP